MDIQNTVAAIFAAVLAALIPVVRAWVKSYLTPQRLAHVAYFASIAVKAAEKLGQDAPGTTSDAKLAFASEFVVAGAKRLGLTLTQDEVLGYVHGALHDMQTVAAA